MSRVLPDPENARTTVLRYKEQYGRISKLKKDILELISSNSCFLSRMLLKYPEILDYLSESSKIKKKKPQNLYSAEAEEIALSAGTEEEFQARLRAYKYKELSGIIYRDLKGYESFTEVMEELSDLASSVLGSAVTYFTNDMGLEGYGEFVVLGMGKLGGRELNLRTTNSP